MTGHTLVLLRHAKAEDHGAAPDFDRRLTDRGHRDAGAAGTWLASQGLRPDLVLCSAAARTRQTWDGVAVALGQADPAAGAPQVHYEQSLYDGGRTEVIDLLRAVSPGVGTVVVVGHNPTISAVSALLRPETDPVESLATCGLAVHELSGSWSDTEPGAARLVQRHTARG